MLAKYLRIEGLGKRCYLNKGEFILLYHLKGPNHGIVFFITALRIFKKQVDTLHPVVCVNVMCRQGNTGLCSLGPQFHQTCK